MSTAMVTPQQQQPSPDNERLYQWIVELSNPDIRENALLELSKKRESVHDLAPMLWHSFGTIASLLQVRFIGIIWRTYNYKIYFRKLSTFTQPSILPH
jgi:hypothetical protein